MERIFQAAKQNGSEVFISPHYSYPTDNGWRFNGPLETMEPEKKMFARRGVLSLDGFSGSGADWLERFKPYIEDGKTVVVSPHRVFGPQTNDLVLLTPRYGNFALSPPPPLPGGVFQNRRMIRFVRCKEITAKDSIFASPPYLPP
jgi:hypothetical protein